jgi:hypothetical protein
MLSVLLAACSNVHTSREAPFDMPALHASMWSVGQESQDGYSTAILVLSSSNDMGCPQIDGVPLQEGLGRVVEDGTGMMFYLEQYGESADWTGTWTEDGAFVPSEDGEDPNEGRSLFSYAFDHGYFYELYNVEGGWLTVGRESDARVTGDFRTDWWWGDFRAEPCAGWDAEAPETTTTPYSF